jgi:cysteine synthase A
LSSGIPQQKDADDNPVGTHPAYSPHPLQGWGPNFISRLTGDAVDMGVIDQIVTISGADAIRCSQDLARKEGIFVGITSGATFAGALDVCKDAKDGATVLCMLPDTGERYLSTPLFDDIAVDMTDEEIAISRTTPNHNLDL